MGGRKRPSTDWAIPYRHRDLWREGLFLDLLCGRDPEAEVFPDQRFSKGKKWYFAERERVRELVKEGIVSRTLTVIPVRLSDRVMKAIAKVDKGAAQELDNDIFARTLYGRSFYVMPDVAIPWAVERCQSFPLFPFHSGEGQAVTEGLKEHRRILVRKALRKRGLTQSAFCRAHEKVTPDILRAVVNGNRQRADVPTWTPEILELLEISERDWYRAE